MKNIFALLLAFTCGGLMAQTGTAINTTGAPPDPSAILDVSSSTQGVLFPRMTESERLGISSPAAGLLVYQTDGTPGYYVFNGTAWIQFPTQGSAAGDMEYWDGSRWVTLPPGSPYTFLQMSESSIPTWGALPGGGVGLGALAVITTDSIPPLSVNAYGGTVYSKIINSGGTPITDYGICWSTSPNPTILDQITWDGSTNTGNVIWPSSLTGVAGTTYYVRAYATNSAGTAYGNELTVTLDDGQVQLVTLPVSQTGATFAVSGGSITDYGGASIPEFGICWSTSPSPTVAGDHLATPGDILNYESHIILLEPGETYYARAYATTDIFGTFYGNEITFTTLATLTPAIGEFHEGGIIFYLDGSGEHGMVVAPESFGTSEFGCNAVFAGATGTAIGTGASNTAAIVSACATPGIPARVCSDLTYNGYSDWYLPSKDEMAQMFSTMYLFLHWNTGLNGYAWSSTEGSCGSNWAGNCSAWYQYCQLPGCGGFANKGSVLNIRPVRSF